MPLFEGRHLSREYLEDRLKRRLDGDPTRGEVAVLLAINRADFVTARRQLTGNDVGGDFRRLIETHLRRPAPREGALKYISIGIPQQAWDEYAREAHRTGRRPSECLAAAIERDRQARLEVMDARGSLERTVQEFIGVARELLHEIRRRVAADGIQRDPPHDPPRHRGAGDWLR